jgi:hypothetical protein
MANTKALPPEMLNEVGRQLRERLIVAEESSQPVFSFDSLERTSSARTSTVGLGTTIELWRLSPSAIQKPGQEQKGLRYLAKQVGWHHQIKVNDKSVGFARSSTPTNDDRNSSVDGIFMTDLAQKIDEAFSWANENAGRYEALSDNKTARLLTVPAFLIDSLWFIDESPEAEREMSNGYIYLISLPRDIKRLDAPELISAEDFVEALRKEPPGMGLIHKEVRSAVES